MYLWYKVYKVYIVPKKEGPPRKWMTVDQIAKETGQTRSIWYRRIRQGAIPSYRIGGSVKVEREVFEEFMRHARRGA